MELGPQHWIASNVTNNAVCKSGHSTHSFELISCAVCKMYEVIRRPSLPGIMKDGTKSALADLAWNDQEHNNSIYGASTFWRGDRKGTISIQEQVRKIVSHTVGLLGRPLMSCSLP